MAEKDDQVSFVGTTKIPGDNREYALPPGFWRFPFDQVDDYAENDPESWSRKEGIFVPMY